MSRRLPRVWLASALLLLTATAAFAAQLVFPALTGRVVDEAQVLTPSARAALTDTLAEHERTRGEQVVVVTLQSLQGRTIEEFGYQLGRHWGIGQKDKNTGTLLIVAPNEHKVRIEVGYGLEGKLTDATSRAIIERDILPAFRHGDFNAGVVAGTAAILTALGGSESGVASGQLRQGPDIHDPMLWLSIGLFALQMALFLGMFFVRTRFHHPRRSYILYRPGRFAGGIFGPGYYGGGYGGGSGGGSSGGGGFSGGGGSFGGGGASGSW